ncbi:group 1 truncated hemoglobin [Pirellulales bacterium]|nr:group 1 truncated hemoglobin [Pirellulales bacterium]
MTISVVKYGEVVKYGDYSVLESSAVHWAIAARARHCSIERRRSSAGVQLWSFSIGENPSNRGNGTQLANPVIALPPDSTPKNRGVNMADLSRRKMLGNLPAAALGAATVSLISGDDAKGQDPTTPAAGKTLYDRLGGYDAISAVVEDFANKLFTDPKVKQFFRGMGTDTKESFKQKNKNLLTAVTGGPAKIISRPAKTAHGGLNITQGDFNVVADHLKVTLEKFNVPEREISEVFAIIATLQPDIVERKTDMLSRDIDR